MSIGAQRDDQELKKGVTHWIRDRGDLVPGAGAGAGATDRASGAALEVTRVTHAAAGLANETVMVELAPAHPGLVLRLPPLVPTFPAYDLSHQALVQNALAAAGVPAPAPAVFVADPRWLGSPFLAMPTVSGFIPGPAPVFDAVIAAAAPERQRKYQNGLIDTLADLHAVDWTAAGLGAVLPGPTAAAALDHWTNYVAWAGEGAPLPILTEALEWCRGTGPPGPPGAPEPAGPLDRAQASLLSGDARLGNLVFDDDGDVHAVLDWDLAAIGPPEMDLGWYFGLDFMMEQLFGRRVPGFPPRAEAVARYEERSGRVVTGLDWYEVFALVRALAINDRQQRIAGRQRGRPTGDRAGREPDDRRAAGPDRPDRATVGSLPTSPWTGGGGVRRGGTVADGGANTDRLHSHGGRRR